MVRKNLAWLNISTAIIYSMLHGKTQRTDITGDFHADGEIYSAMLWELRSQLGITTTDKLVMKSLKYLRSDDGFGEAGDALINADQELNNGANRTKIALVFSNTGVFDSYEWNNTLTEATFIRPGELTQTHAFYSKNDVDWFKFDVQAAPFTWYKIETANLQQKSTDTIITLYNTRGTTVLAINDDCSIGQFASCVMWQPHISGTYYLKVNQYGINKDNTGITFTYDIHITTLILPETLYIPFILK